MKRIITLCAINAQRPAVKVRLVSLAQEFAQKVAKDEKVNCVCP